MIDLGNILSEELKEYEQTAQPAETLPRTNSSTTELPEAGLATVTDSVARDTVLALIENQRKRIRDLEGEVADLKAHPKIETRVEYKTETKWKTDTKYVYRDKCNSCEINAVRQKLVESQTCFFRMRDLFRAAMIVELLIILIGSFFISPARAAWIRVGRFSVRAGKAIASLTVSIWKYMGHSLVKWGLHNMTVSMILRISSIIAVCAFIGFVLYQVWPVFRSVWRRLRRFFIFDHYTRVAAAETLTMIVALAGPLTRIMPGDLNIYLLMLPAMLLYLVIRHLRRIFRKWRQRRRS